MGKKAELNWEFGSVWFWAAFGKERPFVVTVDLRKGQWAVEPHNERELTDPQRAELDALMAQLIDDIERTWGEAIAPRLHWPQPKKRKKDSDA